MSIHIVPDDEQYPPYPGKAARRWCMPIHSWDRVSEEAFHAFHLTWLVRLVDSLNGGLLPNNYFAQIEIESDRTGPDTVNEPLGTSDHGRVELVETRRPRGRLLSALTTQRHEIRHDVIRIREASASHRLVAAIDIVPPRIHADRPTSDLFVQRAVTSLYSGVNLLHVELPRDDDSHDNLHDRIWATISNTSTNDELNRTVMLASYLAAPTWEAYVEPAAAGRVLPAMPLFLSADSYVSVPLEETYQRAFRTLPPRWKEVLTNNSPPVNDRPKR